MVFRQLSHSPKRDEKCQAIDSILLCQQRQEILEPRQHQARQTIDEKVPSAYQHARSVEHSGDIDLALAGIDAQRARIEGDKAGLEKAQKFASELLQTPVTQPIKEGFRMTIDKINETVQELLSAGVLRTPHLESLNQALEAVVSGARLAQNHVEKIKDALAKLEEARELVRTAVVEGEREDERQDALKRLDALIVAFQDAIGTHTPRTVSPPPAPQFNESPSMISPPTPDDPIVLGNQRDGLANAIAGVELRSTPPHEQYRSPEQELQRELQERIEGRRRSEDEVVAPLQSTEQRIASVIRQKLSQIRTPAYRTLIDKFFKRISIELVYENTEDSRFNDTLDAFIQDEIKSLPPRDRPMYQRALRDHAVDLYTKLRDINDDDTSGNGVAKIGKGNGLNRRPSNKLKVDASGSFGALKIDMKKFKRMHLLARKRRKKVAEGTISADLFDLLTKKFDSRREYASDAVQAYTKLVELAGLDKVSGTSKKNKLIQGRCVGDKKKIEYVHYKKPEELLERLNVLIGTVRSGNENKTIAEEATSLADRLHKEGAISDDQYKKIVDSFLK